LSSSQAIAILLARLLMSGVFVFSAIGKFRHDEMDMQAIKRIGLPLPGAVASITGGCEIVGALMLSLGMGARVASALLGIFLLAVSFLLLRFWEVGDSPRRFAEENAFFGNMGLAGGLLYVLVTGPGPLALFPEH